jgi:hypothetical protein
MDSHHTLTRVHSGPSSPLRHRPPHQHSSSQYTQQISAQQPRNQALQQAQKRDRETDGTKHEFMSFAKFVNSLDTSPQSAQQQQAGGNSKSGGKDSSSSSNSKLMSPAFSPMYGGGPLAVLTAPHGSPVSATCTLTPAQRLPSASMSPVLGVCTCVSLHVSSGFTLGCEFAL